MNTPKNNQPKHTQGEMEVEFINVDTTVAVRDKDNHLLCVVNPSGVYGKEEAQSDANLMAEVFNVTNECGLTPRQLLEQNKEMLEALIKLNASHAHIYSMLTRKAKSELIDYEKFPSVIKAQNTIKKATE